MIEGGIHADNGTSTQNNTLFGRTSIVGLRGNFDSVSAGLQDTPLFTTLNVVVDPLRNGVVRSNNLMAPTGFRAPNSVLYRSPDMNGFSGGLMVVAGEVPGNSAANRAFGGSFGYSKGLLAARIAYHRKNNDSATLTGTDPARNLLLGANYDFGPVRGYFGYEVNKGRNSTPLNNGAAVVLTYVRKDDRTIHNQDAQQLGAAYTEGNSEEPGTGNRQLAMGLRHRF